MAQSTETEVSPRTPAEEGVRADTHRFFHGANLQNNIYADLLVG